ncbi:MAG: ion transporter [Flavobacteriales bacterium]|nr:ion transporter [Flavobacteriales bacterium]
MKGRSDLQQRLERIVFGTDTRAGRLFDVVLLWTILLSVALVLLESVHEVRVRYGPWLMAAEWTVTVLFTIEYAVRVWVSRDRRRYVLSFYGLVDLLAALPTYVSLLAPGTQALSIIRAIRLTRVFRILRLTTYTREASHLLLALYASRHRIIVFTLAVLALVTVFGTVMYLVEGPSHGFTSIPRSIYWAIVTLTTVGYGDIAPRTALGQALASAIMILGYAIIAIPTGIVSAEIARQERQRRVLTCTTCGAGDVQDDARYCPQCGAPMKGA